MKYNPVIALDVDGVLIDHTRYHLCRINSLFGTGYRYSDITEFTYSNLPRPIANELMRMWREEEGMYRGYKLPISDLTALNSLNMSGRPIAVSTVLPGHIASKYDFLTKYFHPKDIFFTGNKSMILADVLIDDAPHNIEEWQVANPHKLCYIYARPWNKEFRSVPQPPGTYIVHSLQEVADRVKEDFPNVEI